MEGRKLSKSVPSSNVNNAGRSLSRSRIKCQLCATPVAFTTDVNGTSREEIEFIASLERLHGFLVRFNCLEEGDEGLLSCSATEICGKCKSNLKFAMKHLERAVQQHEKVKGIYEEFTDELQTLQGETGAATLRLQEVFGGAGISQGELQCAIGKAFNNFKHLQDSTKDILECLKSRYNQNSGLFPFLNIEPQDENGGASQDLSDQQDPQQIDEVVKLEDNSRTGEDDEQSDGNENERNALPRITSAYSIAGCYVAEDIAENGCSPAVKLEPSSDESDLADNQVPVVSLESSDEGSTAAADDNENVSATGKSKKIALQKNGKAKKKTAAKSGRESDNRFENSGVSPPPKQKKRSGKKRKLNENVLSTSSKKINSCETASGDVEPLELTPQTSAAAQAPIAGPSKKVRQNQTFKKRRMSSVKSETSIEDPSGSKNEGRQARTKRLSMKTVNVDVVSAENWVEKLKVLESGVQQDAITILHYMAYLEPECIQQNLLYRLPQSDFNGKRPSVQQKVDTALKYLSKYGFIKVLKMDQKTVLSISLDLQKQVKANLKSDELETEVLDSLLILFSRLERHNVNGDQVKEKNKVLLEETIEHALSVWRCAVSYPEIIRTYSALLCDILEILENKNKSLQEEGIKLGEIALENFKSALKPQHQDCFRLEKIISTLLHEVGKYTEAVDKLTELSKKYEKVLKEKDDDGLLLEIKAELGESLVMLGRFEEALTIQRQVLEKTKTKEGENAFHIIREEYRFGRFLSIAGKDREALEMFKSVEGKERQIKPTNPIRIVKAQMNVASTYFDMGADQEALKVWKDAYKTISSRRNRNFELFAQISYWLGSVLLDINNFTEAMEHLFTDYEIVKEELGEDDFWTLLLLQSLGSAHRGNGTNKQRLETALKLHQEAYRGLFEEYGEDEDTIHAKDDLALDLSMLGQHEEALQMFKENISKLESWKRFPDNLMEFKLNYVEALERSGESLEEVLRQLEAIKEEFEKKEGQKPRQIKRAIDLINRVQEKMQSSNK